MVGFLLRDVVKKFEILMSSTDLVARNEFDKTVDGKSNFVHLFINVFGM